MLSISVRVQIVLLIEYSLKRFSFFLECNEDWCFLNAVKVRLHLMLLLYEQTDVLYW
jgi:hypothetical protein